MLAILAALAALGNLWVANAAESKAAERIQREFDLSARPTVEIDGFPILLRIVQGRIPRVTIDGRDFAIQGLEVAHFRVSVEGLKASLSALRQGVRTVRVEGGEAFAEVTQDAVNAYLERQQERGRVTFTEGETRIRARATYGGRPHDLLASGTLEVDGEFLVFTATSVTMDGDPPPSALRDRTRRDASFRVPLPELPGGVRARRIVVRSGLARLEAAFGALTLDLSRA